MNWMELFGLSGFEDFEQVELTELRQLERKHRGHVLRTGRRMMAAMLAAAMILPSAVMAAETKTYPLQVVRNLDGTSDQDPHIEIESNFVHDEFGFLTNTLELAIRVQSPLYDTGDVDKDGETIYAAKSLVQSISVNLAYDAKKLHPVSWEWVRDDGKEKPYPYYGEKKIEVAHYYDFKLETQQDSRVQTATATTGIVEDANNNGYQVTTNIADGTQGLLHFAATAFKPEAFVEMTTMAVIRFAVEDEVMEHIEIKKDTTSKDKDSYTISYDGNPITDVVELKDAMSTALPLVEFAQQKDIEPLDGKADSLEPTLLHYSDSFTEMNYIPDFDPTAPSLEQVTRLVNGAELDLDRPNTAQSPSHPVDPSNPTEDDWEWETLTLARDPATDTYSYTTNLIYKDNVKFTVVSKKSFVAAEDMLDKLTTIVYVDWDNTLLGTQIVPKNTDVRGLVSDYVSEHFIYHNDPSVKNYRADLNLNDPEQIATADGKAVEDIVSSLERKYTYRGKYPATEVTGLDDKGNPIPDTADTIVDGKDNPATPEVEFAVNGGTYPLTNKLDYVFFKRPMQHTVSYETSRDSDGNPLPAEPKPSDYTGGADSSDYKEALAAYEKAYHDWYYGAEWSQKMAEDDDGNPTSDPYWDVEHPYAYGWALCTVDNYEDVWTTLGMGELGSTKAATEAGSLAEQAGSTLGYSGASAGAYQDLSAPTTINRIASVTYDGDAAFAFADLEKGFTESTVFLKAVYEPGPELINATYPYRLYRDPYYNKLNTAVAADGGAYKIEMLYERSNVRPAGVVGVARMREPYVRQDTTTDMKWESLPSKGVGNDDMTNAPDSDAYTDKTKVTYTKIDIENSEVITVSATVSARQNKLDYYLREGYNSNFVAGDPRSVADNTRTDGTPTLDNYTYYVEGIDTSIYNAAAKYSERIGTRGFVLYGTIGDLMEAATVWNNSAKTQDDKDEYEKHVSIVNLQDANIYTADGSSIGLGSVGTIRTLIQNAAAEAQAAHDSGNDMWWDAEHGHASLTYHQLQHYIINGGGPLLPDEDNEAEGDKIKWCRVHTACVSLTSDKPDTWAKLMSAAQAGDNAKIEMLRATEIETYFKLRRNANAALWTNDTVSDFASKVIAAVGAGATTWDQVQYYLINDAVDPTGGVYGQTHYWWYDCSDSSTSYPTIGNLSALKTAAKDAWTDVTTMPDGSTGKRTAKLNQLEKAYDDNKTAYTTNGATAPAWIAATENLCGNPTKEGEPFTTFADFSDKLTKALEDLNNATYTDPDWWQIQYAILNPTDAANAKPYTDADATLKAIYDGYWWHNGAAKEPTTLQELLDTARQGGNAWNGVQGTIFPSLKFASDLKGTPAVFNDVKAKIKAYADSNGVANTWEELQYYLIHDGNDSTVMNLEKTYYWWQDGSSKTNPTFTYTETDNAKKADELALMLSDAYFKFTYNGYTDADSDSGTDFWEKLTAAVLTDGRLVGQDTAAADTASQYASAAAFPTDFTAADVTKVKTAVGKLFDLANPNKKPKPGPDVLDPKYPYTPITWEALQTEVMGDTAASPNYWWKDKDSLGAKPEDDLKAFNDALTKYLSTGDTTDLNAAFTVEKLTNMGFTMDGTTPVTQAAVNEITGDWDAVVASSNSEMGYTVSAPLKWTQIQVLLSSKDVIGMMVYLTADPDTCDAVVTGDLGITPPPWVTIGGYSLTPQRNLMLSLRKPTTEEKATSLKEELASMKETLAGDPALLELMLKDPEYAALVRALLGETTGEITPPAAEPTPTPTPEQKDEEKKDEDQKDDDKVYSLDEKDTEKKTVTNTDNTADDNDSQSNGELELVPKDTETTVPAQKKAEADVSVTLNENDDADDSDSQSAADPPGAELLESVTDLRTIREGPARFRASPQRSPWIRFPILELLPTLDNRRITA